MPLPLLLAGGGAELLAGTVARQALMTGARSLVSRTALMRAGAVEGEYIAANAGRAALSRTALMRQGATDASIVAPTMLSRIAQMGKTALGSRVGAAATAGSIIAGGVRSIAPIAGRAAGLGAAFTLGNAFNTLKGLFGGGGDEGQNLYSPDSGGTSLATVNREPTALQSALPTLRTPSIPGLPTFRSKNKDECCGEECCEVTNKLLSIAVKYLAGIDTTTKNQLDVQRASFTQERQAVRETALEDKNTQAVSAATGGGAAQMIRGAGKGLLGFFGKALLSTIALSLPAIVKTIKDYVFGDDETTPETTPTQDVLGKPIAGATESGTAIQNVIKREGGYVNDPADKGGETKFGISKRSYPNLDIKNLTESQAAAIYKRDYWDKINADQLPANIREMAFDAAVNHGVSWTKEALSKSKNDPQKFLALRKEKYQRIVAEDPSQGKFLKGWMNRLGEFTDRSGATMLASAPANVGASSTINAAALANVQSGTNATTPPPVVVAQNSPPPQSTTVNANGPGEPSSPYSDASVMTWIKYFSPIPA